VTAGYLDDPEKTARQFVTMGGDGRVWYRTGDLVRVAGDGVMHYLSRVDHQVKIRGYRVELAEVEHAAREFSGAAYAVAVPFPLRQGLAEGLVLAVHGASRSGPEILAHCRDRLPAYMVPGRVLFLDSVPLNSNGKIDRAAVGRLVESA
jgi:mycobactin phenyloxazoline synthetase